jgi:drug/metabolite transporter (DMT)-like permease
MSGPPAGVALLLPFVLVSFAANSLITRHVVDDDLLAATGAAWGHYTAAGRGAGDAAVGFGTGLQTSAAGLAWAVVMGAGTTAFAYVAWYACQRALTGAQAGLVQLAIPV